MTTETGTFTPTDEDVERAAWAADRGDGDTPSRIARQVLATIGPIIERERRAAKAEALRHFATIMAARKQEAKDTNPLHALRYAELVERGERE